jgi:putative DNA primase/helicase
VENVDKQYSDSSERGLLGAILTAPEMLDEIAGKVRPSDLYRTKHREIYKAIIELAASGQTPDEISVSNRLSDIGKLEEIGGGYYITGLREACPSAALGKTYARQIREYAFKRGRINTARRIARGDVSTSATLEEVPEAYQRFNASDSGNAELLADRQKGKIKYNHTQKKWYCWNGFYWQKDETGKTIELAKAAALERQKMALIIADSAEKRVALNFAVRSEEHRKLVDCLRAAESLPQFSTSERDWLEDSGLFLQCENGTVHLSGECEFLGGNQGYMIKQSTRINYEPDAKCPRWERFIQEIFDSDQDLISFVQRAIGYTLSGLVKEQVFFLLWGGGSNGKSTLLEVLRCILGDYAKNARFEVFLRKWGNGQSNDLARLHDARLVTASEANPSRALDEETIKSITGGDTVTARFLYQESFEFQPMLKLWLAVNHKPKVKDTSHAFWRRVLCIPFEVQFESENMDSNLLNELLSELEGILNWALRGFEQYVNQGLDPPAAVRNMTKEYRSESDIVSQYKEERLREIDNKDMNIAAKLLYTDFKDWFEANYAGDKVMSQKMFGTRMADLGHKSQNIGGRRLYFGLELLNDLPR